MKNQSKNRKEKLANIDLSKSYNPVEAIKILKENAFAKFDETLEIAINLKINSEKTDQNIRGVINLPKGSGKSIRVAVMAKGDKAKEASKAGADLVGDEDLIEQVSSGQINFDLLIATPDMMPVIAKIGKILGPKGLMPNPKLGTVTNSVKSIVKSLKSGQIEIKNDKDGNVGASIGKKSFSDIKIKENYNSILETILKEKPSGVKGNFILSAFLTSTMGISYSLKLSK